MTAVAEPITGTWTLVGTVHRRAQVAPDGVAMRAKRLGIWRDITWADYAEQVSLVGHGLLSLGIEPGDRVAIHSENRPEWLFADLGTNSVRGITVGLYPTNPAPEVAYLLADSGALMLGAGSTASLLGPAGVGIVTTAAGPISLNWRPWSPGWGSVCGEPS
jgi:long-subunit acyl-CoA synthetase (AMP-forming)